VGNERAQQLEELIGRAPDPIADRRVLVEMRDAASPEFCHLVTGLHEREDRQHSRLGALLPGLALLKSPRLTDLLGVRAANAVARAEIFNWRALSGITPASLRALRSVGPGTVDEILSVAVREWASGYLREDESTAQPAESARRHNHRAPAASARVKLRDLSRAFEDLEQAPGFDVLMRRELNPGAPPAQAVIAAEKGISGQRVSELQATVGKRLARQMRDASWPIRMAAEKIRERLGALARTDELDGAFAALDPDGSTLPAAFPHRRALLVRLADYRISGEWVLGPDIESLTHVVLSAVADSESANLDAAGRHLSRLGVREEVQLRWIVSQWGFRIIDGELVRLAER
jgi:hypothetical protein